MVMNRIGWILATDAEDSIRNGARARELGLRATALTRELDATSLDTLAAAQAEMGEWQSAASSVALAIARARAAGEREYTFRSSKSASGSIGSRNRRDRTS